MRDPSYLCSETFYVLLLSLKYILGNEHWERTIPDAYTLDFSVEPLLDLLPDEE